MKNSMIQNALTCVFPTTVVLVDDDPCVLQKLSGLIKNINIICKSFTNPNEALCYIQHVNANRLNFYNILGNNEHCSMTEYKSMFFNPYGIYKEIYNPERFLKISVVVSDYYMPEIKGSKFCANVDQNIRRILLTDKATDKIAIDEFNNKNITGFLRKDSNNFDNEFINKIYSAIYEHFHLYTNSIKTFLGNGVGHLGDNLFASFVFADVWPLSKYKFVEYYMIDPCGRYLLLDADGKVGMLNAITESELDKLVEIAADNGVSKEIVEKLRSRKYILAFHSENREYPPLEQWENYLRLAEHCFEYKNRYFFIDECEGNVKVNLDFDKIISYNQFKGSKNSYTPDN